MIEKLTKENLEVGRFIQFFHVEQVVIFGKITEIGSESITTLRQARTQEVFVIEELIKRFALIMDDIGLVESVNIVVEFAKTAIKIAVR